jgi:hypothetical protein
MILRFITSFSLIDHVISSSKIAIARDLIEAQTKVETQMSSFQCQCQNDTIGRSEEFNLPRLSDDTGRETMIRCMWV